jgi:hypothetical protein
MLKEILLLHHLTHHPLDAKERVLNVMTPSCEICDPYHAA